MLKKILLTTAFALTTVNLASANGFGRHGDRYDNGRRSYELLDKLECGLTHIKIVVVGDNATITDFDVMFGNNSTQDVTIREYFREGSETLWKDLSAGVRCIKGLDIDATSDRDYDRAFLQVWGLKKIGKANSDYQEVLLDTINVKENYERRRRHRGGDRDRNGHGDRRRP
ncbi:MAG: hypothetical protein KDD58_14395 [Bdellovibrionales bacterium]|nr:hypothetical protein [Bdellovibrionales bacterium]